MKKLSLLFLVTIVIVAFSSLNFGQTLSYTTAGVGGTLTQNFDGLPSTGGTGAYIYAGNGPYQLSDAPLSVAGLAGWYGMNYGGSASTMVFQVQTGSSTSGGVFSFGVAGTNPLAERSLGTNASAGNVDEIGALITNNTGGTLNQVTITYTGEQWRVANTITNTLTFQYKVGPTSGISDGTGYITASALNFVSPITSSTASALDGNAPANRSAVPITYTIGGLTWLNGTVLGIRWQDVNDAGSDHALAIDDWSFYANVQTITNYYYTGSGLLTSTANWGTATNGTGSHPVNFTNDGQIFNIRNTSAVSTSGAWTVSGLGSKIVTGDGTSALALTIVSGSPITGTMDVSNNGDVILQVATPPTFSSLAINSTVDYDQSSSTAVAIGTYGNLKLTGSTKTFSAGQTNVYGNLIVDAVTNVDGPVSGYSTVAVKGNVTYENGTTCAADPADGITLDCNGSSLQTIYGNGIPLSFFRINMDNPAGIVLSTSGGSTNVTCGNLSGGGVGVGSGILTTGTNTVTLYKSASSSIGYNGTSFETAASYVLGNVSSTKAVGTYVAVQMGNLLWGGTLGIQRANYADDLGDVTVLRKTGTDGIVTVSGKSGIQCTWTISSTNPPASGASIKLGWLNPTFLNSKNITTMQAWKSEDAGATCHLAGSQYDATLSTQDSLGVNSFGMFTISDAANPLGVLTPSIGVTALIQGFSDGVSKMLYTAPITVELRDAVTYALVTSVTGTLDLNGTHTFNFPGGTGGTPYWVVIKSVNAVETFSNAITSSTSDYVFDTTQTKAYGNNQILIGTRWCIYNGDVNQDGAVDSQDLTAVDNDNNAFSTSPATDLNGDGTTDSLDLTIVDNNNNAFVGSVIPPGAPPAIKHVRMHAAKTTVTPQK